ncbi:MAG: plastocyanin/azurin family copper-binding protein [Actinomycetota bacterium]|nr:plastocyanin/azurin family copper-binding protein [Actinomycetota bacterium]
MRRFLLAPLIAAALAAAGCGNDGSDTASDAPATAKPSGAGGGVEIGMKGLQFEPKDATVKAGATVTWKNNEDIPHNVVAEEGADFQSDTFGKDGTYEFKAEKAGAVKYVCTIHPGMEGTLTVEG